MEELRIEFEKTGRVKYISHLDMYRNVIRAVRRTDIPVWYTEGFNPHVYLNFALPTPLGAESKNDCFDIRLIAEYDYEKIPAAINRYLPQGLRVTGTRKPVDAPKAIGSAEYLLHFDKDFPAAEVAKALESTPLFYEKLGKVDGKKTMKTVSISDNIKKFSFTESENETVLDIVLSAGNKININPFELLESLSKALNREISANLIERIRIFTDGGKEFI